MKRRMQFLTAAMLFTSCTKRPKAEEMTFRFCEKVSTTKSGYQECFLNLLECYEKTPDYFTDAQEVFVECARLLKDDRPPSQAVDEDKKSREKIAADIIREWEEELDRDNDLVRKK